MFQNAPPPLHLLSAIPNNFPFPLIIRVRLKIARFNCASTVRIDLLFTSEAITPKSFHDAHFAAFLIISMFVILKNVFFNIWYVL